MHSVSWDRHNDVLYVGITQVFSIWAIPTHRAEVSLVTVLHLVRGRGDVLVDEDEDEGAPILDERGLLTPAALRARPRESAKWYIQSQNDLYQTDQFVKFFMPHLAWIVPLWQYFATLVCIVASYVFAPVTWWEETRQTQFTRIEKPPAWNDGK